MSYGVPLMILDQSLLLPSKHFGREKDARVWSRINPTNMKRTLPRLEGLPRRSRLTRNHEMHPELRV